MIYKQSSIDIIGDIIASIDFTVNILSYTNNNDGTHTVIVDNMYHAQPSFQITIGNKKYTIQDITEAEHPSCGTQTNDTLLIKGDKNNITAKTFTMYRPYFFYGTPMAEEVELLQVNKATDKIPMYWLRLDDFSETFYEDFTTFVERDLKFRLYPLTISDHEKWMTAEAMKQAVNPMKRLAELFIAKVKDIQGRFDTTDLKYDIPAVYPKFGVISINKGVEKSLWHDKLGGVEMSMTLSVFEKNVCEK